MNPPKRFDLIRIALFMLPVAVVVLMLWKSPNFQPAPLPTDMRTAPLGSDFLQEYVGGKIYASTDRDKLYNLDHLKRIQHDHEKIGFTWREESYFPMVYPPFYYAVTSHLSQMTYPRAMKLWMLLMGLAVALSGILFSSFHSPSKRILGVCFLAAMFFMPLVINFNMAQKGSLLLLILSATFLLLHHRQSLLAGLVFGLVVFKPHLGIVIGLSMLAKRNWWFCIGALSTVAATVGFSYAIDPNLWHDYIDVARNMDRYVETGGYILSESHSLWGAMQLTFSWLPGMAVKGIALVVGLGTIVLLGQAIWKKTEWNSPRFARQFSAMVLATVLLSPHFNTYDLTILLLPMLLIVSSYSPGKWRDAKWDQILGVVLLVLFAFSGMLPKIASVIRLQPSVLLIVGCLWLIPRTTDEEETENEPVSSS